MSESLKIEAGKFYKTRDGRKAYVAVIATAEQVKAGNYRVYGWANGDALMWSLGGRFCMSYGSDHHSDLVEEWRDLARRSVTVKLVRNLNTNNVYAMVGGRSDCEELLACKTIEITEGEGM
jgi:hypothetical protein